MPPGRSTALTLHGVKTRVVDEGRGLPHRYLALSRVSRDGARGSRP
jgi:hypothetical protein